MFLSNNYFTLTELIKEKDLESVLNAIDELKKIKKKLVTTDNIKNIIFRLPMDDTPLESKDMSIQNASIKQITILNEMFSLKSMMGYEN